MGDATFVFAGGGTGGHLFPGLAVAQALRRRQPAARIVFFTTSRPLDARVLAATGFTQVTQSVRPFTLHPLRLPGFLWAWRRSVAAARALLTELRPLAVLGLGGYAAGPPVVAAHRLGLRAAILNPDAIPGRANRHLAQYCELVALQWDTSRSHFPAGTPCRTVGCPIRAGFGVTKPTASRAQFELAPEGPVLLVTGASQGARSINETLLAVWPEFWRAHPEWQLLHITGPTDEPAVRSGYETARVPARVLAFTDAMPAALAAADLVISRAGASTLAELTAVGRASILLPYPYHRDRHQHANAAVLVERGAALLVEDRRDGGLNAPGLREALATTSAPEARARMAEAARGLGRPEAAEELARWLSAAPDTAPGTDRLRITEAKSGSAATSA